MHVLSQRLLGHIRRKDLLHPGDRVGVAVSGGADSVALLRLLLELRTELGIVISVVHLNHQLRGVQSDQDADFVSSIALDHKLQLHSSTADVAQHSASSKISIETAARELRYEFFGNLLEHEGSGNPVLDKIATGHTLDDQAETVLMRIIRGTGMRGLRAIQPQLVFEDAPGEIIRPLLDVRRSELECYLRVIGQGWREDCTNRDPSFTRNRIRHLLLPLLEGEFNPALAERLSELAEIARGEEDYWDNEAAGWMETGIHWAAPEKSQLVQLRAAGSILAPSANSTPENAIVDLLWLLSEPLAVQRRIVKSVSEQAEINLEFKHVNEILRFAGGEGGRELALPGGWKLRREEDHLEFLAPSTRSPETPDYEYELSVPGEIAAPELGSVFQAVSVADPAAHENAEHLFNSERLSASLLVRNWRPGDRFWPAHTRQPKKLKELFQDRHIAEADRKSWPVILSGNEIVWVRGFPGRAHFGAEPGKPGVLIREIPAEE